MDLKKLFGTVLTLLGIGGLVYAAILFGNSTGTTKALIVYGVLGAIFFLFRYWPYPYHKVSRIIKNF